MFGPSTLEVRWAKGLPTGELVLTHNKSQIVAHFSLVLRFIWLQSLPQPHFNDLGPTICPVLEVDRVVRAEIVEAYGSAAPDGCRCCR